ncbi:MAG: PKD domain-containing protein, partial [Bacteroidetes bacterium]|nr:PKD domain-containing protein [Bacteroidota bacterium]
GTNSGCSFQFGIEKIEYEALVVIPSKVKKNICKFKVYIQSSTNRSGVYNTCCSQETYYNYLELDRCSSSKASPRFSQPCVNILASGQLQTLNYSAIDSIDGDSLSYQLVKPLYVTYIGQYSYKAPIQFKGFPKIIPNSAQTGSGFILDSLTGYLAFSPTQQQVAQIAVEVKEWRKDSSGVMKNIGLVRMDAPVFVLSNNNNKVPTITSKNEFVLCPNDTLDFDIVSADSNSTDTITVDIINAPPSMSISHSYSNNRRICSTHLQWVPTWPYTGKLPHTITVKVKDNHCPVPSEQFKLINFFPIDSIQQKGISITQPCNEYILKPRLYLAKNAVWLVSNTQGDTILYSKQDSATIQFPNNGLYIIRLLADYGKCSFVSIDTFNYILKPRKFQLGNDSVICVYDNQTIHLKLYPKYVENKSIIYNYFTWFDLNKSKNVAYTDTFEENIRIVNSTSRFMRCRLTDYLYGCVYYDSIYINILNALKNPKVAPTLFYGCGDDSVRIKSLITNNYAKYKWNNGDTNSEIVVKDSGIYTVKINSSICQTNDSIRVVKVSKPGFIPNDDTTICKGENIYLKVKQYLADSVVWDYRVKSDSFMVNDFGRHFPIYYKTSNNFFTCISVDTIDVSVYPTPDATFSYTFLAARDMQFSPNRSNYIKYDWLFGDGDSSNQINPTHQYRVAGNFASTLMVTDSNFCRDSSSQSIYITGLENQLLPRGTEVYPNPFKDKIYIVYKGKSTLLEVF